jgi:membrane protein
MGAGRKLLVPVVAGAAYSAGRRRRRGQEAPVEPYPQIPPPAGSPVDTPPDGPPTQGAGAELPSPSAVPGVDAGTPLEIPPAGWRQIVRRALKENKQDNVPLLAAGVAFYAFLALFPGLIAAVTLYGLVADRQQVEKQIDSLSSALPAETAALIGQQLQDIVSTEQSALGLGLVVSLLGALFTASGGVANLMKAINLAYDEEETRGFVKLRLTALLLTFGAVLFLAVAVGLVAVLPVVLDALGLSGAARIAVNVARWAGLVAFMVAALAVVYRYAPDRDNPRFAWVGLGSSVATALWVIGSAGFSLYVSNFGKYSETYGALAGVVVLLLWLFLTSFIVLFGAEINSETEQQTAKDTTQGPPRVMGERRAVKADTVATGSSSG